jgi:hypothetical protein
VKKNSLTKLSFKHENNFYFTCSSYRIAKLLAQFYIYKKSLEIKGDNLEFGVFKGNSLFRLLIFKKILNIKNKSFYAFDMFGEFPLPKQKKHIDKNKLKLFLREAGKKSIPINKLQENLRLRNLNNQTSLIKGDIFNTLDYFLKKNPKKKFSFIHIDVDLHDITKFILNRIWPRISRKGIVMLDDFNSFPGATKAIRDFIFSKKIKLLKTNLSVKPYYIIKN